MSYGHEKLPLIATRAPLAECPLAIHFGIDGIRSGYKVQALLTFYDRPLLRRHPRSSQSEFAWQTSWDANADFAIRPCLGDTKSIKP